MSYLRREKSVDKKTVVNTAQRFRILFMYQTTYLVSILAALTISCDGGLFLLAAFIMYIYIYIYCVYDIIALKRKKCVGLEMLEGGSSWLRSLPGERNRSRVCTGNAAQAEILPVAQVCTVAIKHTNIVVFSPS
jgi:hypothetical protein